MVHHELGCLTLPVSVLVYLESRVEWEIRSHCTLCEIGVAEEVILSIREMRRKFWCWLALRSVFADADLCRGVAQSWDFQRQDSCGSMVSRGRLLVA